MYELISLEINKKSKSTKPWYSINFLAVMMLMLGFVTTSQVQANTLCGPEIKEEAAMALSELVNMSASDQLAAQADLYKKYAYCIEDSVNIPPPDNFLIAAKQCGASVSNLGSLFYEEMSCCGYDPQRRQFACPVKIKQTFGFGTAPLMGSREYVLHCVVDPSSGALAPVGVDSVHLANEMHGNNPTWQFAVIANANQNLHTIYPMDGQTRRARSILSWGFQPTSCNFTPIWGNALNYRIRLDQ
jgi:hypothetical protein